MGRVGPLVRLTVEVVGGGRVPAARGLAKWVESHAPRRAQGELSIRLVSDREMVRLNGTYRGKAVPTDVLSFPVQSLARQGATRTGSSRVDKERGGQGPQEPRPGNHPATPRCLGDIAIATGVARRQARVEGHAVGVELKVLALHGLLHLLGYDHERDRGRMQAVEERLRRRAGLPRGLVSRVARKPVNGR